MTSVDIADLLDEPVWAALTTGNRSLAEGGPLAKRYAPEVSPFAAVANRSPEAWIALAEIIPPSGRLALISTDALAAPPGLSIARQAPILQMVLPAAMRHMPPGPDHIVLGKANMPEMLDLADRTRPGPFGPRTIEFGRYIGIRADGVLAAMAGERMRFDPFVEISAVCVDAGHRGKSYAASLVAELAADLQARGLTPFLHVFASNTGAIALYEKLGFVTRRELYVTSLQA